jgi:hypothetical protein
MNLHLSLLHSSIVYLKRLYKERAKEQMPAHM